MTLETYVCTNTRCKQKNTVDVIGEPEDFITDTCPNCCTSGEEVRFVRALKAKKYFRQQSS